MAKLAIEVVKEGAKDKEVYMPVKEKKLYRVVVRDKETGIIIKETIKKPIMKTIRRGGKVYRYYYIKLLLPWASTISRLIGYRRREYRLVIEVE